MQESNQNKHCAGVLNFPHAISNFEVFTFLCKNASIKTDVPCVIYHKNKAPQGVSKEFNDVGIWRRSAAFDFKKNVV